MKIAARYFTRSGNTKKPAFAIAAAAGAKAHDVSAALDKNADV